MTALKLAYNLSFEDLYARDGLEKVDDAFVAALKDADVELHNRLAAARHPDRKPQGKDESDLLIALAPHLEDFIGRLFGIQKEVRELAARHHELADIYLCKRLFVQRRAEKLCAPTDASSLDGDALTKELEETFGEALTEFSYAKYVVSWLDDKGLDKPGSEEKTLLAGKYASWALNTEAGRKKHKIGVLFKKPKKLDFAHLVPVETEKVDGITRIKLPEHDLRHREGFALTDPGGDLRTALDDANYCIFCHNQGKDSCSKGLRDKPDPVTGKAPFKKSPTGVPLAGCPLEEKISEMNTVKSQGYGVGALAVVAVDNPLCAATGHRICNDCMKSCIYQKQEPVNIPRTETRVLQDVLDLPWGFEIYSLLTRWNPLNLTRPLPKPHTMYKVLVVGLGPAGFNLSHHLLNDGHAVVGIDGLKIEPLPEDVSGVTPLGARVKFKPIHDIGELSENLDNRVLSGFGGVAEYGITVRWNKNYLKIVRLLLERRAHFAMFGGVRFGSTITHDSAFALGFDHIALALGAGKPTIVSMPNAVARGVRTASDFLMALQLTGAAKKDSIANLQVRLPVAVIGGGLTAVDAATESLAYYPVQVEKFLSRYETLVRERGEQIVRMGWDKEETQIAEEFITHARAIRAEREKAKKEGRAPDILGLLKSWGGVTVAYRRDLTDAPSYRLNHEEVEKALEEGIFFMENVTPARVELDEYGHAEGLRVNHSYQTPEGMLETREKILPARTIFMAAGTNPNTVIGREDPAHFEFAGKWFAAVDENGNRVNPEPNTSKPSVPHVLMSRTFVTLPSGGGVAEASAIGAQPMRGGGADKATPHGSTVASGSVSPAPPQGGSGSVAKFVSFFGDLHPSYVGNVVKAMGSAKQGYPVVSNVLHKVSPLTNQNYKEFIHSISQELIAVVHDVVRLTPTIIEVIVKAPLAVREFHPGQFYRLQNYEHFAAKGKDGTLLAMEGLALTGAWVDKEQGLLSTIVLEMGGSSDLCAYLKKGEPVVLMGPTGTPTETPAGETVMLVGGGLGNAVLFSIGRALREAGSKVLYFAGYKKKQDRYKVEEIEKASDLVIWCCDEGKFTPERAGDRSFHGNIVQAIAAYAKGELGDAPIRVQDVDRIITIGSDRMMAAVAQARRTVLRGLLKPQHEAIGSINSPMQCMMKEICAQCLQRHVDPVTGERSYVYSCFNQDQCLDTVDFQHLRERLKQNTVQEKLTALWVDRSLKSLGLRENAA